MNLNLDEVCRSLLREELEKLPSQCQKIILLMFGRDCGKRSMEEAVARPLNEVLNSMSSQELDVAINIVELMLEREGVMFEMFWCFWVGADCRIACKKAWMPILPPGSFIQVWGDDDADKHEISCYKRLKDGALQCFFKEVMTDADLEDLIAAGFTVD